MDKVIAVSGGFDPLHADHVRMMEAAAKYGKLVVILNSDDWLIRKKGYFHQSWDDRAYTISQLSFINSVAPVDDKDGTVSQAIRSLRPDYFGKGGDWLKDKIPEKIVCEELGIQIIDGLGGCNRLHSSMLFKKATVSRPWGHYTVLDDGEFHRVKRLHVLPGKSMSMQRHAKRIEILVPLTGGRWPVVIRHGEWHKIDAKDVPEEFIEVQIGDIWESDIERDEDRSGHIV